MERTLALVVCVGISVAGCGGHETTDDLSAPSDLSAPNDLSAIVGFDAGSDLAVPFDAAGPSDLPDSGPPVPKLVGITLTGTAQIVFDHLTDSQDPANNVPDAQITAWKGADGTVSLMIPDTEAYRMTGKSLHSVVIDKTKIFSSTTQANVTAEAQYNYGHWFTSPYTLDGTNIYTLSHMEWYACLIVGAMGDCAGADYETNSWVTTIDLLLSKDGGATWAVDGAGSAHVAIGIGDTWTGSVELTDLVYHKALNHSGVMTTSRIVKAGGYYYAMGYVLHRDFTKLDTTTDVAPLDKIGLGIFRTTDVTKPSSWQAWTTGSTYAPLSSGQYSVFLANVAGVPTDMSLGQLIYDPKSETYIVVLAPWGQPGELEYITTKSLADPVWSAAVPISNSANFHPDARGSMTAACNTGFDDSNYVSLLDATSPGLNFEFANGSLELYYISNPATCGGDNLARDVYRAALTLDYE